MQAREVRVGLQLRVVLDDDEEPASAVDSALRRLDLLGRRRRAGHLRARVGDRLEDVLLLLREALHRLDEVRNEVAPALQLVLDLAPTAP